MHTQDQQQFDSRPATERQLAFIASLKTSRVLSATQIAWLEKHERALDARTASRIIATMLQLPEPSKTVSNAVGSVLPDVPEGRYALDEQGVVKFYVYSKPTEGRWAGRAFLSSQASDTLYPIRNFDTKRLILAAIAADPKAASLRYGQELGVCGVCGRTLTDESSRSAGIGPICAEKTGWR